MPLDCLVIHVPKLLEWSPHTGWAARILFPSMGTFSIAEELRRRGRSCRIVHLGVEKQLDPDWSLAAYVVATGARTVALSLHWHPQVWDVLEVARQLRDACPGVVIVVGGLTATWFGDAILAEHSAIDAVILGEAEIPLATLVERVAAGAGDLGDVPNLLWRAPEGVRRNAHRWVSDGAAMDGWGFFPWDDIEHPECVFRQEWRAPWGAIATEVPTLFGAALGRGCTGTCTWCAGSHGPMNRATGRRRTAWRSPERVVSTVRTAMEHGVTRIYTCFDPHPARTAEVVAILEALGRLDRAVELDFEAFGLPDPAIVDAFARWLHPSSRILLSPETGDEALRRRHRAFPFSNADLELRLAQMDRAGVRTGLYFLLGLPGEDRASAERTARWGESLARRYGVVGHRFAWPLEMEPGAPWFLEPERFGLRLRRRTLADFVEAHGRAEPGLGYDTEALTEEKILELHEELYVVPELGRRARAGSSAPSPWLAMVRAHGGPPPPVPIPTRAGWEEAPILLRKNGDVPALVGPDSMALFRLGELCDHACPMCPNSGEAAFRLFSLEDLRARLGRLLALGFSRVMLTGGEPTLSPHFWALTEALADARLRWDLNTHGGRLDRSDAIRARASGLERAIVSFHSHVEAESRAMSGITAAQHASVLSGIEALRAARVEVWLNTVVGRANLESLPALVAWCADRFPGVAIKISFPLSVGKGRSCAGTQLGYDEVRDPIRAAVAVGRARDVRVALEGFPNCVSGDEFAEDVGRAGWGESHYLLERDGTQVVSMRAIEARERVYGVACASCAALDRCPGIGIDYVRRAGLPELAPFPTTR